MELLEQINELFARYGLAREATPTPAVAVIRLTGVIGHGGMGGGMGRRGLSLANLDAVLKKAFSKRVRAVCLVINSPGGSPVQSSQIANRIRQLSQDEKIPVFAFAEDVAASGGYWLALAADEIYADPMSVIGSIGVVSASFGFHELLEKIGIERRVHAQGERKGMLDPFRPEDPADVQRLNEIQVDIHRQFIAAVKRRREERLSGADETLFNGDIWTGERALELGLIDGLGDMRTIMRRKYGSDVRFLMIDRPGGWLSRRFGGGSGVFAPESGAALAGGFAGDLLAAVEERAFWARFGL